MGNEWLLVCFANSEDRDMVFQNRPWFVNGLNFILLPWTPFFNPFQTNIDKVDQWIRIPRLPWEFWDQASLESLLNSFGTLLRVGHNTLFRLKGSMHVCA